MHDLCSPHVASFAYLSSSSLAEQLAGITAGRRISKRGHKQAQTSTDKDSIGVLNGAISSAIVVLLTMDVGRPACAAIPIVSKTVKDESCSPPLDASPEGYRWSAGEHSGLH